MLISALLLAFVGLIDIAQIALAFVAMKIPAESGVLNSLGSIGLNYLLPNVLKVIVLALALVISVVAFVRHKYSDKMLSLALIAAIAALFVAKLASAFGNVFLGFFFL